MRFVSNFLASANKIGSSVNAHNDLQTHLVFYLAGIMLMCFDVWILYKEVSTNVLRKEAENTV